MSDRQALRELAARNGIVGEYWDVGGHHHATSAGTDRALLAALGVYPDAPVTDEPHAAPRLGSPPHCHALPEGTRVWGVSLQLYSLRSERNWGIGDFTDLAAAIDVLAAMGADLVGVNPLHLLFSDDPEQASPYSPSSRLFLNPLYIDVEAVPEGAAGTAAREIMGSDDVQATLGVLRNADRVDYARVAALKLQVLEVAFSEPMSAARQTAFATFRATRDPELAHVARFCALRESDLGHDPQRWPPEFRDPSHEAVRAFAAAHADRVDFHAYLQWVADEQLAAAADRCRSAGMKVGLYGDLALGSSSGGADVWMHPDAYVPGVAIGAPPDDLSPEGQSWGLPPLRPATLQVEGGRTFDAVLRAAMRHFGALRIDHVMGLRRQFWVPDGRAVSEGAYVDYPFELLLDRVVAASVDEACIVVGEDLGTVTDEVRDALRERGVHTYKVMWFEKRWHEGGDYLPPHDYPTQALATASTHDLPTIAGFLSGRDIEHRRRIGVIDGGAIDAMWDARRQDRDALRRMLVEYAGLDPSASSGDVREAIHRALVATPCSLAMIQIEDVFGLEEQSNLPSTVTEHPNWRRRLPVAVEDWEGSEALVALSRSVTSRNP